MKKLILILAICICSIPTFGQTTATYDIVFTSNWDAHGTLPGNAHFTELVGATHNATITLLEMGAIATPGIEQVAETGRFNIFTSEVNDAISNNTADQFIEGPNLFPNPSSKTITINDLTVNSEYPLISLASMIAPSPDWMIAVNSVSLVDDQGQWISEIVMDLFPYDSGTENGTGYSLSNSATNPVQPISIVSPDNSPFNSEKIGTIVFSQKILNTPSFGSTEKNPFIITPNPSNTGNISIATPSNPTKISDIEIYDVLGKIVKSYRKLNQNRKNINLNLSSLHEGIYLVRMYTDLGETQTQRLILH